MINFITPCEDRDPLYAGVTERLMFWSVIKNRFPSARRYWTAPGYPNVFRRYTAGILRLPLMLVDMTLNGNRIFVLLYPNFPFMPTHGWSGYIPGLMFFLALKVIAVLKRGTIAIRITDAPRLAAGGVIDEYTAAVGETMMKLFEKIVFNLADVLWATSVPQCEWFARDLNIDREKIRLSINGTPAAVEKVKRVKLPDYVAARFVYAGSLAETKGVRRMLDAFANMSRRDTMLILTGVNGDWIPKEYDDPRICYVGCMPTPEDASAIVKACDVGVLPYPRGAFADMMFPNKLSFYITCGTPILSTDMPETARIVRENGIGLSCSLDGMAKTMDYLAGNLALREKFRSNCRRIRKDYFWETILDKALGDLSLGEFPRRQYAPLTIEAL